MRTLEHRRQAADQMVDAARAFYKHGWLMGTSGNLSVRDPGADTFLITASGKDKGRLTTTDFLVCDPDAHPIEPTPHRPSAETLVHGVIYRAIAEAGAIYHVHQVHAALCSDRDWDQGKTVFEGLEMIKGLGVWQRDARIGVPIVENHYDIPDLAAAIGELLAGDDFDPRVPGVNIRNHGIYAWGKDADEAKRHIESFGYLFHYSWERGL
ncbi:MAG: methylthioribulose 1-phosphate dehydratase [Bradymonadaceae bacterium]|nr:methylthioribulose 1-phosphate dehydratase [Lujinxingiaceae bacterium]